MRTAFKNFRRDRPDENGQPTTPTTATGGPPSKRLRVSMNDSTTQLTQEEYEDAVTELKQAYRGNKKKRNYATIKLLMESTQPQRREWILEKRPLVAEIVEMFPFLSSSKTVSLFSNPHTMWSQNVVLLLIDVNTFMSCNNQ